MQSRKIGALLRRQGVTPNPSFSSFWRLRHSILPCFQSSPVSAPLHLAHRSQYTTIKMDHSRKRKADESDDAELEARAKKAGPHAEESQSSDSTLKSEGEDVETSDADSIFESVLATLPPLEQWSSATIEELRSAISEKDPKAEWQEESEWTRRVINAILAPNQGSNWQRLKTCSNADYFSLPIHTITLLNALLHANCLDAVKARCKLHGFHTPLDVYPDFGGPQGPVSYPIFRVDYSSDETFELYKTCWDQFMERQFFVPKAIRRRNVSWHWVEDKAKLERGGLTRLFQSLLAAAAYPNGLDYQGLWLCLMVDREAIESMLRVYGPPATEIFTMGGPAMRRDIPFLPYLTTVSTTWTEENDDEESESEESQSDGSGSIEIGYDDTHGEASGNKEANDDEVEEEPIDDGEYHGDFKFALQSILEIWQSEQSISPDEYYPRDRSIWGDIGFSYEPPTSLR
ncbi:hypothetical protein V8E51_007770 [Hyaloscypha variabilis]